MSTAQHLRNVPIFSDLKDSDLEMFSETMSKTSTILLLKYLLE